MAASDRVESTAAKRPWYLDVGSGLAVATVSVPAAIAAGVLCFSAVGPGYWLAGAVFGLMSAAISALLSSFAFRSSTVVGPVSTVCVTQAILIASLASHPLLEGDPGRVVALMTASVLLTGLVQLALAALKVGSIIEFTPYPVVAGFLNGVAFLTIGSQVLFVLHRTSWAELVSHPPAGPGEWAPLAFLAVFTLLGLTVPRRLPGLPAPAVNFAIGLALYYAALAVVPETWLGPRLTVARGTLDAALTTPSEVLAAVSGLPSLLLWQVALAALTVAAIGIVEMSMTARMVENASQQRLDKHRQLTWLGLTNLLSAPMGVPSSGSVSQTAARWHSGGVGPLGDLVRGAVLVLIATIGIRLLDYVPVIVVCGQLVLVGIGIFDAWSARQVLRMTRASNRASRHVGRRSLAVIAIVMVATASGHIVLGAALGIAAACWIFIADTVSPLIRARLTGDAARSRKARPLDDLAVLRAHPRETVVLVLQGPVFFGNAVELTREVARLDAATRIVMLDLRRVTSIDVSAIATIGALARQARRAARLVAICGVPSSLAFMVDELRNTDTAHQILVFADREAGLEWAEDLVLARSAGLVKADLPRPLGEADVTRGFAPDQLERFRQRLTPLDLARGAFLCREGDEGDTIWILVQGSVSIRVTAGEARDAIRVGSFAAGTTVGEIAFLQGSRRTASIVADEPLACFSLSRAAFERMSQEDPLIAALFYRNVAGVLAERLAVTTDQVRANESA
ncbi:SulP family inorganic anion transporter [uncultured Alsobacter sp.]|uniref:SLC26A/SulP transporter family protein n=1 Tax=uncultured Alsobacter sp. TaxID=1748258 RepID=UPI0025F16357|nr:SulP family inorganic anion transporter [uncultured Alsobacter sp.]